MGPCCDDHRQPRRCGRSCASGCTSPVLWHSVCADSCPWFPSRKYPAVLLPLRTRGQPSPHVVENAPEATSMAPCGYRPRAFRCVLRLWAPASSWPSPTTGTFHAAGCVSFRQGRSTPSGTAFPSPHARHVPRRKRMSPATQKCPRHTQDVPPLQYRQDSTHILLTLMVVNCHQIDRGCQKWIMQPPLSHGRA